MDQYFSSLNFRHLSLITHYSSLITHHLKYPIRLALSLTCHHSIFFTLFVGLMPVTRCSFFFFFFFLVPKLTVNLFLKKKKKKTVAQPQSPVIIQGIFTNARAIKMPSSLHSITQTTPKIPKKKIHRNPKNPENHSNP